ncbi:MAG: S8 family serine peptidase [Cloacibacillus evryensis]
MSRASDRRDEGGSSPSPVLKSPREKAEESARGRLRVKSGGSVIQLFSPIGESVSGAAPARASSTSGGTLIVAHLRAAEGESTEDFIARLTKDPDVVSAMPNYLMRRQALKTPNDPLWARQWGPRAAKAPEVWRHGTGTAETVVAVIDSGVIYDHPDLKDDMFVISKELADKMNTESGVISGDFAGSHGAWYHSEVHLGSIRLSALRRARPTIRNWDIDNARETMTSTSGHWHTWRASSARRNNKPVSRGCWNVKILPVNVFSYSILGDTAETSDLIRGIDFVLAAKRAGANIRVVNMSFGMWGLPKEMEGSAYDLKIKEMSDNGMLLALAAGNDGEDLDAPKKSWLTKGRRFYPACFKYENTISVGALKKEENGALSGRLVHELSAAAMVVLFGTISRPPHSRLDRSRDRLHQYRHLDGGAVRRGRGGAALLPRPVNERPGSEGDAA